MKNLFYYAKNFSYNALPKAFFVGITNAFENRRRHGSRYSQKRLDYYFKIKTPFSIPKEIEEIQYLKESKELDTTWI